MRSRGRRGNPEKGRCGALKRARIVAEREQKERHATAGVRVQHGSAQTVPRAAVVDRARRFMGGYLTRSDIC